MISVASNHGPVRQRYLGVHFGTRIQGCSRHERKLSDRSHVAVLRNQHVPAACAGEGADNSAGKNIPPPYGFDEIFWSVAGIDELQFGHQELVHDTLPTPGGVYAARRSLCDAPVTLTHRLPLSSWELLRACDSVAPSRIPPQENTQTINASMKQPAAAHASGRQLSARGSSSVIGIGSRETATALSSVRSPTSRVSRRRIPSRMPKPSARKLRATVRNTLPSPAHLPGEGHPRNSANQNL
jgi:hypothetical protein